MFLDGFFFNFVFHFVKEDKDMPKQPFITLICLKIWATRCLGIILITDLSQSLFYIFFYAVSRCKYKCSIQSYHPCAEQNFCFFFPKLFEGQWALIQQKDNSFGKGCKWRTKRDCSRRPQNLNYTEKNDIFCCLACERGWAEVFVSTRSYLINHFLL